jgi:RNA polymerase sigma-70 factor, ECF subfamily
MLNGVRGNEDMRRWRKTPQPREFRTNPRREVSIELLHEHHSSVEGVSIMGTTIAELDVCSERPRCGYENEMKEMMSLIADRGQFFHRVALRYAGDPADAEDAVQDAFLSAYVHLGQFKGKAKMSTWLTTIVMNCARMRARRRSRRTFLSLDGPEQAKDELTILEKLSDQRPGPEDLCRKVELLERITHMSAYLSPTMRRTFQLRDLEGWSIREVSESLGVTAGVVKTHSSRARAKLRHFFAGRQVRNGKASVQSKLHSSRLRAGKGPHCA